MSDFIFNGYDYIDHIKSEEDLKLFNRLKELAPELSKPAKECLGAIMEAANIDRKLRGGKPIVFIDGTKPKLN